MAESVFEIRPDPGDPGREEKVAQLFNAIRAGERLSGLRRTLFALLAVLTALLVLASLDRSDGSALVVIGAMAAITIASVARLSWLERRNQLLIDDLVAAVGARRL